LTADGLGKLDFSALLDGQPNEFSLDSEGEDSIFLRGRARERKHSDGETGVSLFAGVRAECSGGDLCVSSNELRVEGATQATIYIALGTDFSGKSPEAGCKQQLEAARIRRFRSIRESHIADHRSLFGRVSINLGGHEKSSLPIDRRMDALRNGESDPDLCALYFQFGRYLLVAGSRGSSPLPLNLQGIWNDGCACAMEWTCDFHLDINTQMNYWPAEVANLSECNLPLFRWIEDSLVPSGQRTAKVGCGRDGWVANTLSNAWGFSAPGWGLVWGIFLTGGVWVATHLWEHFLYSRDKKFLKTTAYPILKGAAVFFEQDLVAHPETGTLVTGPSISPENCFRTADGEIGAETMGPACDSIMLRELFASCIEASEVLGVDEESRGEWRRILDRLPPLQVSKDGRIQEWMKDYEEPDPAHRHITQLTALYPFHQIDRENTPALAAAAAKTLSAKQESVGFEAVEWNLAWFICFYAKLGDSQSAYDNLKRLMLEASDPNLFSFSASGIAGALETIMVVDGNLGATAGIAEMLVQSHRNRIDVLPALPKEWAAGSVAGLRVRGGFEVHIKWEDGILDTLTVHSRLGGMLNIRYKESESNMDTCVGEILVFDEMLSIRDKAMSFGS